MKTHMISEEDKENIGLYKAMIEGKRGLYKGGINSKRTKAIMEILFERSFLKDLKR